MKLYHGTLAENKKNIEQNGLIPQKGSFISTMYMNPESLVFACHIENMTKAEVISYLSEDVDITKTHSCITQRFGDHDGTCYGCVIRRLGSLITNKKDVKYKKDPLTEENSSKDNLLSLLLFSQDLLMDYCSMPFYQVENIEAYQKHDLYRRFALDNFAAIRILESQGVHLTEEVQKIYEEYVERNGFSMLEQRASDVRRRSFRINEKPR